MLRYGDNLLNAYYATRDWSSLMISAYEIPKSLSSIVRTHQMVTNAIEIPD